jgi:hypothetical protein
MSWDHLFDSLFGRPPVGGLSQAQANAYNQQVALQNAALNQMSQAHMQAQNMYGAPRQPVMPTELSALYSALGQKHPVGSQLYIPQEYLDELRKYVPPTLQVTAISGLDLLPITVAPKNSKLAFFPDTLIAYRYWNQPS